MQGIGAASITDEEFAFPEIQALTTPDYSASNYAAILLVLDTREVMSATRDRLRFAFLANGAELPVPTPSASRIFLGSGL